MLRNIRAIHQKFPTLFINDLKLFFCQFNDPLFIKIEKIDILTLLATSSNQTQILDEFQEYA